MLFGFVWFVFCSKVLLLEFLGSLCGLGIGCGWVWWWFVGGLLFGLGVVNSVVDSYLLLDVCLRGGMLF